MTPGPLLCLPLVLFLGAVLVYPITRLTMLANFNALDRIAWIALRNSVALSALVAIASVALCIMPAWVLARSAMRGKTAVRAALTVPMTFSGVVVGFLAIATIGRAGALPLGTFAYGFAGLVTAYLYFEIPRATLALEAAFRQIDPAVEAAAATLGVGPFARMTRLILPMTAPSIAAVLLLTFSVSLGSYGVALLLSRRFTILPVEIYAAFTASLDDVRAATMSLLLLAVALAAGTATLALRRGR